MGLRVGLDTEVRGKNPFVSAGDRISIEIKYILFHILCSEILFMVFCSKNLSSHIKQTRKSHKQQ
jgi:hypothetical protein